MENEGAVHIVYDGSAQGYHQYHMVPAREPNWSCSVLTM